MAMASGSIRMSATTALHDDVVTSWNFGGFGGEGWTKHEITVAPRDGAALVELMSGIGSKGTA